MAVTTKAAGILRVVNIIGGKDVTPILMILAPMH